MNLSNSLMMLNKDLKNMKGKFIHNLFSIFSWNQLDTTLQESLQAWIFAQDVGQCQAII